MRGLCSGMLVVAAAVEERPGMMIVAFVVDERLVVELAMEDGWR